MSLDEPESTDRDTLLGKQPWHTNTGFSTLVLAADWNIVDVSAIDVVVEDVIGADIDDTVEAIDANPVSVTSVVSTVDDAANDGVDHVVSVAEVVVSAEAVIADAFDSDDVCYPVIDSSFTVKKGEAVRSCLIDPSVVQRKRGTFVPVAKKGDASACVCDCCLAYNCFERRDYCLKGCVCDCYETSEGRMQMERKIEEERDRMCEGEEDRDAEESWKGEREERWKRELEESLKGKRERSPKTKDLNAEY